MDMLKLFFKKEDLDKVLGKIDLEAAKTAFEGLIKKDTAPVQARRLKLIKKDASIKDTTGMKLKYSDAVTKPTFEQTKDEIIYSPEVWSEEKKFLANHEHAFIIKEFALHEDIKFTCDMKYLPIKFKLVYKNHKTNVTEEAVTNAFLQPEKNELLKEQMKTPVCQKIKRFL